MQTWVKDMKTGAKWILDDDESKPIYQKNGQMEFDLKDIARFRFFPCDPDNITAYREDIKKDQEGYQFSLFDYKQQTCGNCDCYSEVWNHSYCACFSAHSKNKGRHMDENDTCDCWESKE